MRVRFVAPLVFALGCQSAPSGAPDTRSPAASVGEPDYEGPPKRVLVELFSSQGCNSCPAADAFLGELPDVGFGRADVVALTFHVTYWDDLGWHDPYADALFDQRQIGYAQQLPAARDDNETTIRGPYTPQMVVDGKVHFSGSLRDVAKAEIERARQSPTPIDLEIVLAAAGTGVDVIVESKLAEGAELDTDRAKVGLFAALAQTSVETEVPRGENAGKRLTEHWVVRDFVGPKLFRSSRENETSFTLDLPQDVPASAAEVVVFAQDLSTLRVLAVATATLDPVPMRGVGPTSVRSRAGGATLPSSDAHQQTCEERELPPAACRANVGA